MSASALAPAPAMVPADILVVDDASTNLELLSELLKAEGYHVRPVSSGPMALEAAQQRTPDLVLLDFNMPEMSGYEVCVRLKQLEQFADVPILFVTALTATSDKLRAFEAGAADYITKPFRLEEVKARVGIHLRVRRLHAELARQNQALREVNEHLLGLCRLRDNLVHMIVHDLRSPLTGIYASLRFIEEDLEAKKMVDLSDVQQALRSSTTLMSLINDLLDIHRMESQEMPLELQQVSLALLIDKALAVLGPAKAKRIETSEVTPVPEVTCDPRLMERVFVNLLDNALKFSPGHSTIELGLKCKSERWILEVKDRGAGIPQEYREKIFEKFGQIEARQEGGVPSTGLGLAFCKLAVNAHGGQIFVEERLGGGSVFRLQVPTSGRMPAA